MRIFIASILLVASSVYALDNIPDNEIATCKVKSNDFIFMCYLNTKNYHSCKFMIGTQFDLPNCKPCDNTKSPIIKAPEKEVPVNPLLKLFGVKK